MKITVKTMKGNSFTLQVESSNTIERAKNELMKYTEGIPRIDWNLYLDGIELEEFKTFAEYSIQDNSTLRIGLQLKKGAHFLVKGVTKSFTLEIGKFDTLDHVQEKIRELTGCPPDQHGLIFGGVKLSDGVVVDQMDIVQAKLLHDGRMDYLYLQYIFGKDGTHPTIGIVFALRGGGNIVHHQPLWNLSSPSPNDHGASDEEEFRIETPDGLKDQNVNGANGATINTAPVDAPRLQQGEINELTTPLANEIYDQPIWEDGSTLNPANATVKMSELTYKCPVNENLHARRRVRLESSSATHATINTASQDAWKSTRLMLNAMIFVIILYVLNLIIQN